MKKLLVTLLCLPMMTLAQLGSGGKNDGSYYYPREESVSDGGAKYDGGITHVVGFLYNGHNYPDSIYAFHPIVQGFGSLTYSSPHKIDNVFLDLSPFGQITLDYTYISNNVSIFSIQDNLQGTGMTHELFYNPSNKLIKKHTTVIPSGEEYKKTFTYSNGKLTQMDYFSLPDTTTPIQTDILTYNMSNPSQLQNIELSNGVKFEYGYNSVTNFCETVILFYNNNYMDTVITREYDTNGNMVKTSIKEFDFNFSPPTLDNHRIKTYTYDAYNRNIKEEDLDINTNQLNANYADYIYFSIPTGIKEHTTNKQLLKVTDILGRETKGTKNEVFFYIYDDGTVEKRIVIE